MNHTSSYYDVQAQRSKTKRDRLKAAAKEAGGYISTARSDRKALNRSIKPSAWKGVSAKKFEALIRSVDSCAGKYVSQMDSVRDGYNREQAAANTSYLSFLSKWKAAIENEFN